MKDTKESSIVMGVVIVIFIWASFTATYSFFNNKNEVRADIREYCSARYKKYPNQIMGCIDNMFDKLHNGT